MHVSKVKIALISILVLGGCVMDRKSSVLVIANDTDSNILVVKQPYREITDNLVFSNHLDWEEFNSGEIKTVWLPYSRLRNLPPNERAYFYVFNTDSLEKYRGLKKANGIIKLCLIKEFSLQLNEVKDQLDTLYVSK